MGFECTYIHIPKLTLMPLQDQLDLPIYCDYRDICKKDHNDQFVLEFENTQTAGKVVVKTDWIVGRDNE